MREIKFRVWIDNEFGKEMVEFDCDNYSMKHNLLLQYTGLKDKNGKDIFEGDIIKETKVYRYSDDVDVNIYQIVWNENVTGFTAENENGSNTIHQNNMGVCEVIGNIYENPELLEENK